MTEYKKIEKEPMNVWKVEQEGDQIEGEVKRIHDGVFGRQLVFEIDGEETFTPSHKALVSQIQTIKEGDQVKIVHTGTQPSSHGQPTMLYDIFVAE